MLHRGNRWSQHSDLSHVEKGVGSSALTFDQLEGWGGPGLKSCAHWFIDDDGSYVFRARLTPEQGERVACAIEAACDENDSELKNVPAGTSEHPETGPQSEPVAQRRADALERLADAFFGAGSSTVSGGDRCTIHLHTTPDTLAANGDTAEAELESGARITAETSRRLACDCGVVHWHDDEHGSALNVGRRTRSIPPALRRAL